MVGISGAHGEVLKILRALTIEDELLVRGLEVTERSVDEVLGEQAAGARVLKFGGKRS